MLVDVEIVASRWRVYMQMTGLFILIGILGCSGIGMIWQVILAVLLVLLQCLAGYVDRQQPKIIQLWQSDSRHWYWRLTGSRRTYRGQLRQIRSYGVLVYAVLQSGEQRCRVVLWRDQVNDVQWRYLMIHASLK